MQAELEPRGWLTGVRVTVLAWLFSSAREVAEEVAGHVDNITYAGRNATWESALSQRVPRRLKTDGVTPPLTECPAESRGLTFITVAGSARCNAVTCWFAGCGPQICALS